MPELTTRTLGARLPRREDRRLLIGRGSFLDDSGPRGLHATFVRSPYAHARVRNVDASTALAAPGIVAVLSHADFVAAQPQLATGSVLADDEVVYVGHPVAIVVADSRAAAEDAIELVDIDYEQLAPVIGTDEALHSGHLTNTRFADNVVDSHTTAGYEEAETALARCPHVFDETFSQHRYVASPIECRGIVAQWEPADDTMTVWVSSQGAHGSRETLCAALDLDSDRIRVLLGDVGGAFGQKIALGREEKAVAITARALQSTVRWVEDRWENLVAGGTSREEHARVRLGTDDDGRLLALVVDHVGDIGAQGGAVGVGPLGGIMFWTLSGGYRIPHVGLAATTVRTNTMTRTAYRGPWMFETVAREMIVDVAARGLGIDPAEVRRRNVLQADDLPYHSPTGVTLGAITPSESLEQALEILGYEQFRAEQRAARAEGRYLGVGISAYVEPTAMGFGIGATAGVIVRIDPAGKVQVTTAGSSQGHSIETTLAQIVADTLGVAYDDVTIRGGDTALQPIGKSTGGSSHAVTDGGAALHAATELRHKILAIAAHVLECDVDDVELVDGTARVRGVPASSRPIRELATLAYMRPDQLPEGTSAGLESAVRIPTQRPATFANATHVCTCEVDRDTGVVRLLRYIVSEDCGVMINPTVVEGQIAGGVVQGIGGVLYEHLPYDDDGNPLATTFLDYLLPTTTEVPMLEYGHLETPSATPGGFKGVGEGGAIAAPAAVINAIADALAPLGVKVTDQPLTPSRIVGLVHAAATAHS